MLSMDERAWREGRQLAEGEIEQDIEPASVWYLRSLARGLYGADYVASLIAGYRTLREPFAEREVRCG